MSTLFITVPAFAQGAAPPPAEDTTNDSNVVVEETEKSPPLTPEGNAALVDDFGGNKQLISAKYGLINDRANRLAYADDSSYYLLCALEVIDEDGKLERKADMFTKRTIKPHQAVATVDTASEALAVSISEKNSRKDERCEPKGYRRIH